MSDFRIEIKKGNGFVHAQFYGPVRTEGLSELMKKSIQKAIEWDFNNFFADFRQSGKRDVEVFDDYDAAYSKLAEFGFKLGSKHAILVRKDDDLAQWKFVETVFRNAGYFMNVFTDEKQALEWVQK